MIDTLKIRDIIVGQGKPKICVPIVAQSREDILREAKIILDLQADIVEWRADWFDDVMDISEVQSILEAMRKTLKDKVFLFTFRTKPEGGEKDLSVEQYLRVLNAAADSGCIDMIDVELYMPGLDAANTIKRMQREGGKVIASNHNFNNTPDKGEIVSRLVKMDQAGADILKIAVMPEQTADVLTLLDATQAVRELVKKPVVTMAMGPLGVISRMSGEIFGSAITFGAVSQISAPGQLHVNELTKVLDVIHESLKNGK